MCFGSKQNLGLSCLSYFVECDNLMIADYENANRIL